ncbi:MAG: hypothetical protein ACE5EK_09160 [Nitrospinales bacterium]
MDFTSPNKFFFIKCFKLIALSIFLLLFFGGSLLHAAGSCSEDARELRGRYEVLQGDGGLWRFFESQEDLREQATLGLQTDGKLNRAVVIFETKCQNGSNLKVETFKKIQGFLDRARALLRANLERTTAEKLLAEAKALKEEIDALVASLEKKG